MKYKIPFHPFDNFVFRSPLFTFDYLQKGENAHKNRAFAEALLIASPDLSDADRGMEKTQNSVYRYFQRACTRSTPFGLFAGCSIGTLGDRTDILLLELQKYRRKTRFDMNYICSLSQQFERNRNIRKQLRYFPNTSIYQVGDNLRYVEYHYVKTRRVHRISQVENSEYLQRVLNSAKSGMLFTDLVALLVRDDITAGEATDFIHELVDAQVLVSDLEPAVTHVRPLSVLIDKLNGLIGIKRQIVDILSEMVNQLETLDQQPIGNTENVYPAIFENIKRSKLETDIKYLFQVDMFKPVKHATISHNVISDIQQALAFLNKITLPSKRANLIQFRENFIKRYNDREMPLLFVLDSELGLGYANNSSSDISPLVDDLVLPQQPSHSSIFQPSIPATVLQRYQQQSFPKHIELTDEDVKNVVAEWNDLPETMQVMCEIIQDNENGRSIYIKSCGGPSATNLLGRFCHLDEQILNHTLAIAKKETQNNPNFIFAEIVHLPESRTGNILLRPVLRPYEIPYLAKPTVTGEFELNPNDLFVSVKNNRIVLRSKYLNKEIIPRMSTAHNFSGQNSMPVYHFLCDIQQQSGRSSLGFYWNEVALKMNYLPRVIYKNCILSKARWLVDGKETKTFTEIGDDLKLLSKIKEWQFQRSIPDSVTLADGDNELYVNFSQPLSIRAWLSVVKKRHTFQLKEFLFDPATAVIHSTEGVYTNEFIFAFYRDREVDKVL